MRTNLDLLRYGFHQRQLFPRQRRVGPHHHQRRVDVRDERMSCRGIPSEYRAQAGRIHETHSFRENPAGHKDFYAPNSLGVLRVPFFRNVLVEVGDGNLLPGAIPGLDARPSPIPVPDDSRNCGHGE